MKSKMDETMVERVAKALFEGSIYWGYNDEAKRSEWNRTADLHRSAARAAIAAMREPTEEMVEASNREWDGRMSHRSSGAWQAMIDTALADRPDSS